MNKISKLLVVFAIGVCTMVTSFGQVLEPFSLRFKTETKGGIKFVSNAILECNGGGAEGAECINLAGQLPPLSEDWSQNNDHTSDYIDIDADPSTFSSSADSLSIPSCSEIVFAGIYWGGRAETGDADYAARETIKLDINNSGYYTVDAAVSNTSVLGNRVYYCFADITEIVIENVLEESNFTVADLYARTVGDNLWGGWNIVVVYKNDLLKMKQLNVFDGLINVNNAGTDVEVNMTGFLTPPSGAVDFEVGVYGYDGDRGFVGDSLLFDGGSGFVAISNSLNPASDIFNSSITKLNTVSNSQTPSSFNNINIDADIFAPDNSAFAYIGNSATEATIKITTDNETVQVQVLTLAIDVYEPDIRARIRETDLNGGTVEPGDTVLYEIVANNIGSDPALECFVMDTIPSNTSYVPESIEITFGPNAGVKTDAAGDDVADYSIVDKVVKVNIGTGANSSVGGTLINSPAGEDSTVVQFKVVVIDDCVHLSCEPALINRAIISGLGDLSGNAFENLSTPNYFDAFGCPLSGRNSLSVDLSACALRADTTVTGYCASDDFISFDYTGYSFFDSGDVPVTAPSGVGTYYATKSPFAGCIDTINIVVADYLNEASTAIAGDDIAACVNPGIASLSAANPSTGSGTWSLADGTATILNPSNFDSGVTDLSIGTNKLVWTVSNSGCGTNSDTLIIVTAAEPSVSNAGGDLISCNLADGSLNAEDPAIGVGSWSVIDGAVILGDPDLFNTTFSSPSLGENTLRWTVSNGVCAASEDEIILLGLADIDDDGYCDADDLDEDNDGIPDIDEGMVDSDGDGLEDYIDRDSDNDGIPDIVEAGGVDVDGDGAVDDFIDLDGDGLDDNIALSPLPNIDTDKDGIKNYLDRDSDNDGLADLIEAGGVDSDGDGVLDDLTDTDGDGFADIVDTDDNSVPGVGDGGTSLADPNSDGDIYPNRIDLDSDNDGVSDASESGGSDSDGDGHLDWFADVDGDGFSDVVDTDDNTIPGAGDGGTPLPINDQDLDGHPNYRDYDSDNDGIVDVIENNGLDVDGDGQLDGYLADVDGDGFTDQTDTDNNNIDGPFDGGLPLSILNSDGTGGANYLDIDTDGDGIIDNVEGQTSFDFIALTGLDTDGDGLDDAYDLDDGGTPIVPVDFDGDGSPDYRDLNTDNDAESDLIEGHDFDGNGVADIIPSGTDSDSDGLDDAFDNIVKSALTANLNGGNGSTNPLTDGEYADFDTPDLGNIDFREIDTDKDGVPDEIDLDNDNDGVPDVTEGDGDTDNDGILDIYDRDSDNDGIGDLIEAGGIDIDFDGRIDDFVDDNDNGLHDPYELTPLPNGDSDLDGVVDAKDLDADNDGIADIIEAGGIDINGDGRVDEILDADNDGFADFVDSNDDNVPGTMDGGTPLPLPNNDSDSFQNRIDLDSDNDGIPDVIEAGGTDADGDGKLDDFADIDGDGFSDVVDTDDDTAPGPGDGGTNLLTGDFDFDLIDNYRDIDSDNDGLVDLIEAGGEDTDGDGRVDVFVDVNSNGYSDTYDAAEGGTPLVPTNTDALSLPDYLDIDSDQDGIIDNIEGQTSADYIALLETDADGDGLDDAYDLSEGGTPIQPNDHDLDGIYDYVDIDSDNDGISDLIEGYDTDADGTAETTPSGTDSDNDGLDDAFDFIDLAAPTASTNAGNNTVDPLTDGVIADVKTPGFGNLDFREKDADGDLIDDEIDLDADNDGILNTDEGEDLTTDTDNDGIPNYLDLDSDNDGVADLVEAGGIDVDGDGRVDDFIDLDADGLDDGIAISPLPLTNSDEDEFINAHDLDSDNDGIADIIEAGGSDVNGDGRIDDTSDTDNDGFSDLVDSNDDTADGPGDGGTPLADPNSDSDPLPNRLDLDSDNDGISDVVEAGGTDADGNGLLDGYIDADGDGFSDVVDTDNDDVVGPGDGGTALEINDFDLDGKANYIDLDSDNDGIVDVIEADGQDVDGNGELDDFVDANNNGFSDVVDTDAGGTNLAMPNTDGLGKENYLDIDADNDGIIDNIEGQTSAGYSAPLEIDTDGDGLDDAYDSSEGGTPIQPNDHELDGTPDYIDVDSDGDGVSDAIEGFDTDGDGTPEIIPAGADDDNDGLDNAFDEIVLSDIESATNAANNTINPLTDGVLADFASPGTGDLDFRENDSDGDLIDDAFDLDADNDGIPNAEEGTEDSDNDGIADILDLDSDNDGIADIVEAGGVDADNDGRVDDFVDINGDGLDDNLAAAPLSNVDADGDEKMNSSDLDSDNDGIYDRVEENGIDADNDGIIDNWADDDGDGIVNFVDVDFTGGTDDDGDGIDDAKQTEPDTDGDGIGDEFDNDANGDGWDDTLSTSGLLNSDSDAVSNFLDVDSDNDGASDLLEDGGVDSDNNGRLDGFTDANNDGADDTNMRFEHLNDDTDTLANYVDLDSDNDGVTDAIENGMIDANADGRIDDFNDADGDGWNDAAKVASLTDTDSDGTNDMSELDADNDGLFDVFEADGMDAELDGLIDGFLDENGDGLMDDGGLTPPDTDSDGNYDFQDIDSDDDTVPDSLENDANNDGIGPDDTDGDGILDFRDTDDDQDGKPTADEANFDENGNYTDCDKDGIVDYLDPDLCDLIVPEGFSPNGDDINELFVIRGIEKYPSASITIFNRWGNKVYVSENGYANNWNGTNQFGNADSDKVLPTGTYFYILTLGDEENTVIKGYVYLNK
jgi:gliding motility-associated-like protein/uncharacterized repeat protein (TIGR01451 family)